MKDGQGSTVRGRTRWGRFAVAFLPAVIVAGALFAGVANGAVPIQLVVSGQTFKVSADQLDGTGFHQYGSIAMDASGKPHHIAVSDIRSATLHNLCQSVYVPMFGVSLVIRAGQDPKNPATASDMQIGMDHLVGDATFKGIDIGQDASTLSKGSDTDKGALGQFGQQADSISVTNLKQTAYSTHAGTFNLNGLDMRVDLNGSQCFPDLP